MPDKTSNASIQTGPSDKPLLVVGSGPAGLAAAFKLHQDGFKVKILEAQPVLGGKLRSKIREGFILDQGAFFISSNYERMLGLTLEAGFGDKIRPGGTILALASQSGLHQLDIDHPIRDFLKTRFFTLPTKLSLVKLLPALLQAGKTRYANIGQAAALDDLTAEQWADNLFNKDIKENLIGLIFRAMSGTEKETCSRVDFYALLNILKGARLLACDGGMGAYAENLLEGIERELNARVLEIVDHQGGVLATWQSFSGQEHQEHFAGCVVAGSTETVVEILPQLDDWRREYLGSTPDRRMFIANIGLSKPVEVLRATYTLIPRSVHPFLSGICCDHFKAQGRVPDGKGLLSLMPTYQWAQGYVDQPDDVLSLKMLEALDSVAPGAGENVEFVEITRWTQRYNPPGYYRNLQKLQQMSESHDSRIQLAGDYFGYANLETAFCSGERAAGNLLRCFQ